ncbi:(2Fe-2S)-binding protein [Xylanibacillus composti]|uniref:2Fe-2S ferredoxin-type domain-containing protein n=1 Tax=Xylanibacillus composti TaxID=1572762 RepID=A0A8J4H779_9BACL|nr:2Fe-2S iron-sulfur cluster-binding protein [Xylanibacillus composti]MDT9725447.1 (2Fe-2S)-binding protein [Xylanibacillus composti]GIQ71037.1 hypothetical protein XYCOK13_38610 [Xylanibacillus composti]
MLTLKGRTKELTVQTETGQTILDLALKHDVDWGFSCTRGTCARCRCYIEEGRELLAEPTEAEWARLDEEELEDGYRLGCQAVIRTEGTVRAVHRTYW